MGAVIRLRSMFYFVAISPYRRRNKINYTIILGYLGSIPSFFRLRIL